MRNKARMDSFFLGGGDLMPPAVENLTVEQALGRLLVAMDELRQARYRAMLLGLRPDGEGLFDYEERTGLIRALKKKEATRPLDWPAWERYWPRPTTPRLLLGSLDLGGVL